MTTPDPQQPSVAEIAALTARLRHLRSPEATDSERAAFQADKTALLDRIPDHTRPPGRDRCDPTEAAAEAVMARAAAGGYAMVGPSARTWAVDPATGIPTGPVSEAEHRLVRELIGQERLDGTDPVWLRCADGGDEIVALVVPTADLDDDLDDDTHDRTGGAVDGVPTGSTAGDGGRERTGDVPPLDSLPAMPAEMVEGIEARRTEPARPDDPAELEFRLAELSARVAEAAGQPPGGWRTVSAAHAADRLVGRGYDVDTARALVVDYLRETSERIGAPAHEWGLDQGDVDAIDAAHRLPEAAHAAVEVDEADAARAAQLGRWHTDDQAAAEETASETDDAALVESGDETGWSE